MITAGVDIGSATTETVILDQDKKVLAYNILRTGAYSKRIGQLSMLKALKTCSLKMNDVGCIISTGYGRANVAGAKKNVSEITCLAKGVNFVYPGARTILDIGGQDSKAIGLGEDGNVVDFAMNDKCAAGTGRFLEVMAGVLGIKIDSLGSLSLHAQRVVNISSICTVFAESEVISLIHEGVPPEDIAKALHEAITTRALSLLGKVGIREPVLFTGGVAKNIGMVKAIKNRLGLKVIVPEEPQILCAIGAALVARQFVTQHIDVHRLTPLPLRGNLRVGR